MSRARAEPVVDPDPPPPGPDQSDLESLYRLNAAWLKTALLRRFGPRMAADADDLVQESFLRAAKFQKTSLIRAPRALLAQIARRLVLDQARRDIVRRDAASDLRSRSRAAEGAAQEELVLLKQILLTMPERYRTVFLLARFEGLSHAAIAARLGLTEKAVEWRLTQALAHCSERLARGTL